MSLLYVEGQDFHVSSHPSLPLILSWSIFVVLRTTFVAAYISIISTFAVEIKVLYKTFPLFVRGSTFIRDKNIISQRITQIRNPQISNFHGFPSGDTLSEQRGYHPLIGHGNHTDIQRG